MSESTIEPKTIEIDRVRNGVAEILVHWDAEGIEREGQALWSYQECRMEWVLPRAMVDMDEVVEYLSSVESEILDWAKGSKVSL